MPLDESIIEKQLAAGDAQDARAGESRVDLRDTLVKLCNAVLRVVGAEETPYTGTQDYLVIGDEVNNLIRLAETARQQMGIDEVVDGAAPGSFDLF